MIKHDDAGQYVGIACNTCDQLAPPANQILAGHGLVNMGWHCSGGTHICDTCEHPAGGWPHKPTLPVLVAGGRGAG